MNTRQLTTLRRQLASLQRQNRELRAQAKRRHVADTRAKDRSRFQRLVKGYRDTSSEVRRLHKLQGKQIDALQREVKRLKIRRRPRRRKATAATPQQASPRHVGSRFRRRGRCVPRLMILVPPPGVTRDAMTATQQPGVVHLQPTVKARVI